MKKYLPLLTIITLLSCSNTKTPIDSLHDVVHQLKTTPTFEYTAYFNIQQDGITMADTTKVYIEQTDGQGLLPLNYVFESMAGDLQFFDGQIFNNLIK